jgi:hypothetical protein
MHQIDFPNKNQARIYKEDKVKADQQLNMLGSTTPKKAIHNIF